MADRGSEERDRVIGEFKKTCEREKTEMVEDIEAERVKMERRLKKVREDCDVEIEEMKVVSAKEKKRMSNLLESELKKFKISIREKHSKEIGQLKDELEVLRKQKRELETRTIDIERDNIEAVRTTDTAKVTINELEGSAKCSESEVAYLRQSRNDMAIEREDLLADLHGYQQEVESMYKTNKVLRGKIRRLEETLYGRKIRK